MAEIFIRYFHDEMEQVQIYAQEHRSGNDHNRRELDRRISIMLRRFHHSVEQALQTPSSIPAIEQRRKIHLMWKSRFLRFTGVAKYLVVSLTVLFLLAVWYFGGGSAGAKVAYRCFLAAAAMISGIAGVILYQFKRSTKEFLIEQILCYEEEKL